MTQTVKKAEEAFMNPLFEKTLKDSDPKLKAMIDREFEREQYQIELIASENIVSQAVLEAQGSVLTNKYAEGYPGKRYYGGCEFVDEVERLAIERACKLFDCGFANVQPHSGSQANQAVFMSLMQPGDTFLGMSLDHGGHLTHGSKANQSGKWFNAVHYGVREEDGLIDHDMVRDMAIEHKPKVIVAGASAYPRKIDFAFFREIADEVGAYLMVDMAHYAGLVAPGEYPSPIPHAHVVTTTTHKTLRGPRGGMILTNDEKIAKKVNSAIFPGLQGGPLEHVIAAKAVAFGEALDPSFKTYTQKVISNCKVLAKTLVEGGVDIFTGGTDSHMILVDLRPFGLKGNAAEESLERARLTTNKNAIPFDEESPFITSGIRVGTPAGTTRGFGEDEFKQIGLWMIDVLKGLSENGVDGNAAVEERVASEAKALCEKFPIYGG
jgi:glycine hydroxymethyltransferase